MIRSFKTTEILYFPISFHIHYVDNENRHQIKENVGKLLEIHPCIDEVGRPYLNMITEFDDMEEKILEIDCHYYINDNVKFNVMKFKQVENENWE